MVRTLLDQGSQLFADLAHRQRFDSDELEPVRGHAQPHQITGTDAQGGQTPRLEQQRPVVADRDLGHATPGQRIAVEERRHVCQR